MSKWDHLTTPRMPPHIDMVLEILTNKRVGSKACALCGRVIESYYNRNRRAIKLKPRSFGDETESLSVDEGHLATGEKDIWELLSTYEQSIKEAHRMVQQGGRIDQAILEEKLARAVELLDSFRPDIVLE
jgi:hypothetical protein